MRLTRNSLTAGLWIALAALTLAACQPGAGDEAGTSAAKNADQKGADTRQATTEMVFPSRKNDIERTIDTVIHLCATQNLEVLASRMIYTGKDAQRKLKDTYHFNNGDDADVVRLTADVVGQWQKQAERYAFGKLSTMEENAEAVQVQEVIFMSPTVTRRKEFLFVASNGRLLLMNIRSKKSTESTAQD